MKTPYKGIYQVLKINRLIVIGAVVTCTIISVYALTLNYQMWNKTRNEAFAINTSGDVIPLKMISQREDFVIEAKDHLYNFHKLFFGINQNNYESNIEKALWYGDASVEEAYKQKLSDGTYNRLIQYSLNQKIIAVQSDIIGNQEPFEFYTKVTFEINRGTVVDRYEQITKGKLILIDRAFPQNSHGIWITNYHEQTLTKIENDRKGEK